MEEKFSKMREGFHWVLKNSEGETLSIILNEGSYGFEEGKFETQCSWVGDVQGNLTFGQVQQKIDTLKGREKQNEN